ncbi:phosphoribosylamine--glycine ligase [Candidatus Peregrinibacteria bacterium]|nr:phosphoribosylamine--glycine ligase [Candidatus Peregrinibacteria bacterium]
MASEVQTTPRRKFLFVSYDGTATDLAWTVSKEGNDVKFYMELESSREIGDGFFPLVDKWEKHINWADVIVFDHIGSGFTAKELRDRGKLVIGGTPYSDQLEHDRAFGQEELKRHGVRILPFQTFSSFPEAIAYVQANPSYYVVKPSGHAQNLKQLLYVGQEEDGSDVIRMLGAYEKSWADDIDVFQLQKRVTGVEVAVCGFFNGKKFLSPIFVSFEHKKLFPGDLGVSTGEMGTSAFWSNTSPIFDATLKKMEETLAAEKYVGPIDINSIVNSNGIYPLEFTCRFGYPEIQIQQEGILEPMGELLYKLAKGEDFTIRTKRGYQVCALLVVPPFPFNDPKTFESFSEDAVVVFKKQMKDGVHIADLREFNGEWLIAGEEGIALIISGSGSTMSEAQKQMYSRIGNVQISNMYYRTDIGSRWMEDSDKLRAWNYL